MMHVPVLLNKAIELLDPKPGEFFIDGTFGNGGHAAAIVEKIFPGGKLLGIDWDKKVIANGKNVILVNDNYKNIPMILKEKKLGKADGLLLDLGMSSDQLESAGWRTGRGFSFKKDEPLDMRYGDDSVTAAEVVNTFGEDALVEIFKKYGEERYARRIAEKIVEQRKKSRIITTFQLSRIVEDVYRHRSGRSYSERPPYAAEPSGCRLGRSRIHPATKIFQALRIYVNNELENLDKILDALPLVLKQEGRAVVISFHSLEDRIVKNKFKEMSAQNILKILTKKPVTPDDVEVAANPRSRSAKLRAAQLL